MARAGEFDLGEFELEGRVGEFRIGGAVFGKKIDLAGLAFFVDGFDGTGPAGAFAVVDLAEVEEGFLYGAGGGDAAVFDDAPVSVFLAVFETFVAS